MICVGSRTEASPIAPQVRDHEAETILQTVRHSVPGSKRLRIAVQQEQWRTATSAQPEEVCAFALETMAAEARIKTYEGVRTSPSGLLLAAL
jgi:hypothetical protein